MDITQKKICKKCNCIESDINKFEKIRHSCIWSMSKKIITSSVSLY